EGVVCRGVGGRRRRRASRGVHVGQRARPAVVDRDDRIVDRRGQHRELVGRVDRGGLIAGRGLDSQQEAVPLDDGIDGGGGRVLGGAGGRRRRSARGGECGGQGRGAQGSEAQRPHRSFHDGSPVWGVLEVR